MPQSSRALIPSNVQKLPNYPPQLSAIPATSLATPCPASFAASTFTFSVPAAGWLSARVKTFVELARQRLGSKT